MSTLNLTEAVEAGARALAALGRVEQDGLTVGQQVEREWSDPETREYLLAHSHVVLEAVGYAALLAEVERLRAGIAHIVDRYGNAPGIETCATMYDLRRLARVTP